jgi:hypothetical protein
MRNPRSTCLLSLLCALAAWIAVFVIRYELPPRTDRGLHAAIGKALAQEAIHLMGPGGSIVLITRDTESFPQPAITVLTASFERALRRAGARLADRHEIQLDPLRPVEVPPGDFYELMRRAAPGNVIVSLMGPPVLTEEQQIKLGAVKPKIVAFCAGNLAEIVDFKQLFDAGFLHAAVISRSPASPAGAASPRGSSAFDRLYTLIRSGGPPPKSEPLRRQP